MQTLTTRYRLIKHIHERVNTFPYKTDTAQYGVLDFWERISNAASGDCEDFVLEKRAQLLESGVPVQDLRIGLCYHPSGGYHAVLVVKDDNGGDWISDQTMNFLMSIQDMKQLGYRGDKLQVPGTCEWEGWII